MLNYRDDLILKYNEKYKKTYRNAMDRVGFEPTTSAMPMPYPTRLDDRPPDRVIPNILHINICYMCDNGSLSPHEVKEQLGVSNDIFNSFLHMILLRTGIQ